MGSQATVALRRSPVWNSEGAVEPLRALVSGFLATGTRTSTEVSERLLRPQRNGLRLLGRSGPAGGAIGLGRPIDGGHLGVVEGLLAATEIVAGRELNGAERQRNGNRAENCFSDLRTSCPVLAPVAITATTRWNPPGSGNRPSLNRVRKNIHTSGTSSGAWRGGVIPTAGLPPARLTG